MNDFCPVLVILGVLFNNPDEKNMSENKITRKSFLRNISVLGATAFGASTLITACGGGDSETQPTPDTVTQPAADPCGDTTGLSESDLNMRRNLQYVHETHIPEQRCDNCQLWIEPDNGKCGGCALFRGPVNPNGWCNSWVVMQS
ncbi:MAG: hypothetical protein EA364_00625 [Balneolaceae bacterium]|nr:MAG: hypothetical protein EA364_00625 [Balneolaceae bacterium]